MATIVITKLVGAPTYITDLTLNDDEVALLKTALTNMCETGTSLTNARELLALHDKLSRVEWRPAGSC